MNVPESITELDKILDHKNLENLKPARLIDTLHKIASDQSVKPDWRASARKTSALIKNIIRTKEKITIFEMLLVIQATPFGNEISSRIIFYATVEKFHSTIQPYQKGGVVGQYLRASQP